MFTMTMPVPQDRVLRSLALWSRTVTLLEDDSQPRVRLLVRIPFLVGHVR